MWLEGKINSAATCLQDSALFRVTDADPRCSDFSDVATQFEPWYEFARASLRARALPWWNPFQGFGSPHIANMQSAFFYPLTWLAILLGPGAGLLALYAAKLLSIGLCTFLYLRKVGIRFLPATIGTLAFTFSGYNIGWLCWPQTNAIFFLPLSFFLLEKILAGAQTTRSLCFFSIGAGVACLGGHPESFAQVAFADVLYLCGRLPGCRVEWKRALGIFVQVGLAGLLGILLAGIQVVPFVEYLVHSEAIIRTDPTCEGEGQFLRGFHTVLNMIPDFLGNRIVTGLYFVLERNYIESLGGYVGMTMLVLAFLCAVYVREKSYRLCWIGLSIVTLATAYQAPVISSIVVRIPFLGISHLNRLLFVHAFAVSCLGAQLLSEVLDGKISLQKMRMRGWMVVFSLLMLTTTVWSYKEACLLVEQSKSYAMYFKIIMFIAFANYALIVAAMQIRSTRLFMGAMLALVMVETVYHGTKMQIGCDPQHYFPRTGGIHFLQANLGLNRCASLSAAAGLDGDVATYYGLQVLEHYDAMLMKSYVDSIRHFTPIPAGFKRVGVLDRLDPVFLSVAGVRYLIAGDEQELMKKLGLSEENLAGYPQVYAGRGYRIFENTQVLPRAFAFSMEAGEPAGLTGVELLRIPKTTADIVDYRPDRVVVEVDSPSDGYVFLSDSFFPGWHATVNGKKTAIMRNKQTNFRIVPVAKGHNQVVFSYRPWSFVAGAICSLGALGLIMLCILSLDIAVASGNNGRTA